jgi:hypothetical protein
LNPESPAREVTDAETGVAAGEHQATMEVLRSHVPLSLLMDLASSEGPDSEQIAAIEGGDADWLQAAPEKSAANERVTASD